MLFTLIHYKITEKKDYNLSLSELMCDHKPKPFESEGNWKESKGFFCSSLVAASYMSLGMLPVKFTSGKYLPGN